MIRLAVSVEGRTEEEFVKTMLADHLRGHGVDPTPILIGGPVSVERLAREIRRLYGSFDAVTSLVDFYGFRGREDRETADEVVMRLDGALRRVVREYDPRRVISYIQSMNSKACCFQTWIPLPC